MRSNVQTRSKVPTSQLAVAGLFAGIGGLELGFERCGGKTVLLCEIDPAAQKVLSKRFPGVPIVSDIRNVKQLPHNVDVVTAGFPCQDLSMAGSKTGIEGRLSSIVACLFDLLSKRRVEWIVIENVYFMLQLDHGRAMAFLSGRLERLGYRWAYRVIDTISFLPQRRRRVFLVASLSHDPCAVLFDSEVSNFSANDSKIFTPKLPVGFYWTEGRSGLGLSVDAIPPLKAGSSIGIPSPPAILLPDGMVGMPTLADCERLQGFPAGWTAPARSDGKDHDRRWRLVGNAVSVPVACWLARRLIAHKETVKPKVVAIQHGRAWPSAGFNVGGGRAGCEVGVRVTTTQSPALMDVLKDELRPLSSRAINGFLSRAREGGLRFPCGFLDRVRACLG